jgi:signal transduction histidine kinase
VFDRFYRVDAARSRESGGSGLGLAIVKQLVESHGGAVSAASEPGQGAVIGFTLPAAPSS